VFQNSFLKALANQILIALSRERTYEHVTVYVHGTDYRDQVL